MNKYHNTKVRTPTGVWDSKKEYQRHCELSLLQRAGEIKDLREQVSYELIPKQKGANRNERNCSYIADFVYSQKTADGWEEVVEDTKGCRSKEYIIKRKLMLLVHHISIKEV